LSRFAVGALPVSVFSGADTRAQKANEQLRAAIMAGETVVVAALQLGAVNLFLVQRRILAITSSRIIVIVRHLFGGLSMKD